MFPKKMLTFEYKFEFSVTLWQLVLISKGLAYNSSSLWKKDTCISFHYITLHYITLHYITLHYITLHYITLHYITLHYITLHYITLHYITIIVRNITQGMTYSKTLRFLVAAILFSPICYIFVKNQHRYTGVTPGVSH